MEEKYESFKQKILKLNELALRGEEGEAINAWKTLQMVDGLENVSYLKSLEDK